ncbi:MAG TPA: Gfo/Idh/MocA family oxidoreductase [Armatimonadota bacterium]|nr:Gfo/Idh/MocA family oxidoreductase [Armatimonadota bacterium]
MSDRVRFGIVGCGVIGPIHAEAMSQLSTAELVAVADIIPERAQKLAEQYHVDWYGSYEELLARSDIDAISICTPSGMHADHGMMAARAGKHVLSEKPMDVYVNKVDELVATCQECHVTLGGIFQQRCWGFAQQAKQVIEGGWLGDIVLASASCLWFRAQDYYNSGEWRGTWAMDAGVLSNQSIHTLDRLLWLTGMQPEIASAYCPTLQRTMEAEDLGIAVLKFPNGAGGVIQATTLAIPGIGSSVTICGTKGSLVIGDSAVTFFSAEGAPEGLIQVGQSTDNGGAADPAAAFKGVWGGAHAVNINEFATAILEGREPTVNAREARKAVQLLNDIYRAAQVGPWSPSAQVLA